MKQANNRKGAALVLVGALIGASLPTAVTAAENWLKVTPSTQEFFVDGHKAELEAYAIEGHNYVKLRDIGKAVDFGVSYDPSTNSVMVNSGSPYQEEPQTVTPTQSVTDYTAQVNPAVFAGYLTKEVYNTIRETITTGQTTSFGSAVSGMAGLKLGDDEALFQKGEKEVQQLQSVLATLGQYPSYQLTSDETSYLCQVRYSENYIAAVEHTKSFIDGLAGLSEREKVKRIAWYVCDRLAYDSTCYAWPSKVLTQDGAVRGACMSYAYSFQFLCQQAEIPCLLVSSSTHQWNTVYAEDRWWEVDVTANDCDAVNSTMVSTSGTVSQSLIPFDGTDTFREQYYVTADRVLWDRTSQPNLSSTYTNTQPEVTRFAQELLVPGSTK